jgi:hypothetical protein
MKLSRFFSILIVLVVGTLLLSGCKPKPENTNQNQNQNQNIIEDDNADTSNKEAEEDTQEEAMTWITFRSERLGFTLSIPSTWIIVDEERYGILLRPKEETQTSFYVDTHTTIFSDYSIGDFINEMIGDVQRIRSDATFSEPTPLEINGYPFTTMNYEGTSSDGLTYYYEAYFSANNNLGFEMYYVADENEFELYKDILRQIAVSFEFLS